MIGELFGALAPVVSEAFFESARGPLGRGLANVFRPAAVPARIPVVAHFTPPSCDHNG